MLISFNLGICFSTLKDFLSILQLLSDVMLA